MEDDIVTTEHNFNTSFNSKAIAKDTFTLGIITRDPFLNGIRTEKKVYKSNYTGPKKSNIKALPKKIVPTTPFPLVKYYGFIKSTTDNKELILLSVNGKFSRVKLNEEKDGIKVTSLQKDSIKVSYNKEFRWFLKK
ncbi:MAG: hypothetical protein ACK4R1_06500 [Flavobacterium sp.]